MADPSGPDSAGPNQTDARASELRPIEFARWVWRQLTSMRTALALLFLLAVGAIPGSVIPQDGVDSMRSTTFKDEHPKLSAVYDKIGLFDVYGSPWFAAIYLLLMVSLVGCIVPRCRVYWRASRALPPKAPKNLLRLPESMSWQTDESPDQVLDRVRSALRKRHYRLGEPAADSVAAERGYLREAGNLIFHLAILVVLAGFAVGSLFGFKGGVIVVTGDGFANTLSQYDDFVPGSAFQPEDLQPFSFDVEKFSVSFITSGRSAGAAHEFYADLMVRDSATAAPKPERISVNHPLTINGTKVFLIGHGYAPRITIKDGEGNVAYSGPTVFLPQDESFTSFGLIKVPDSKPKQLAFEGEFYPTYAFTMDTGPFSAFPDARNPAVSMLTYSGDLGLDDGDPQSVYALDKSKLTAIKKPDGAPFRLDLGMGQTKKLPDDLGTVTFDGVDRFVRLQVSSRPGSQLALAGTVLALIGLLGSLFIRPRRIWVRVRRDGDRTMVELAGLDRSSGGDLAAELAVVSGLLGRPDDQPGAGPTEGPDDGPSESTSERQP